MVAVRVLLVLLVGVTVLALPGCRCSESGIIARLTAATGTIERDWSDRVEQWEAAQPGAEFRMGDAVKSGERSTATLSLRGNATLSLTPKTVVRFLREVEEGRLGMDVAVGEATVQTTDEQLRIQSSIGAVVIEPGTQMRMSRSEQGIRFEIAVGRARIHRESAGTLELKAGKGVEVSVGGAVIEQYEVEPADAEADGGADAADDTADDTKADIIAETTGDGARMRAPGGGWSKLAAGSRKLEPGTAVRIEDDETTVLVQRGKQRAALREGEFVVGLPGGYLVQAVKGPVRLSSGGQASVSVPGGVIVAKGEDTSADVDAGGEEGTTIRVHVGEVEVRAKTGGVLRGGESGVLSPEGELSVSGRGPGRADLVVDAGDSFTVHDPRPPPAIGFRLGEGCDNGAVVVLGRQQWAGRGGQINVPVGPGRHSYEVKCLEPDGLGKTVAEGRLIVLRDAGTAPIARKAPSSHVNTDGRRYTVLYQNRLPAITVGWAGAPEASSYTLVVDGRQIGASSPNHAFSAGALGEGNHTVHFEASTSPPRRSRTTHVTIRFDNATPTASLDPVASEELASGSAVTISGRALPGWKVSVGGEELEVQGARFRGSAKLPEGHSALPVRFQHPTRGTHYYLRRPSQ